MLRRLDSLSLKPVKLDLPSYPVSLELYLLLLCDLCRIFKRLQFHFLSLINLKLVLILLELLLQSLLLGVVVDVLYDVEAARLVTLHLPLR